MCILFVSCTTVLHVGYQALSVVTFLPVPNSANGKGTIANRVSSGLHPEISTYCNIQYIIMWSVSGSPGRLGRAFPVPGGDWEVGGSLKSGGSWRFYSTMQSMHNTVPGTSTGVLEYHFGSG